VIIMMGAGSHPKAPLANRISPGGKRRGCWARKPVEA
jgi:hypothetical protein